MAFPLIGAEADSIAFESSWQGMRLADGFDGAEDVRLGVVLNLTDSTGDLMDAAVYSRTPIPFEDFDYTKGFIHTFDETNYRTWQGILFNIDSFQLVDTLPRPLIKEGPESQVVRRGDDVLLSSELETNRATIQWSLNGVEIMEQQQSDLSLEDIQPTQSGTYMVTATANDQTSTAIARIQVESREHFVTPISLKGWNADVIVEPGGDLSQHAVFDGGLGFWFKEGFQGHPAGFPASGRFTSSSGSGALYQLQSSDQENVLLLTAEDVNPFKDENRSSSPSGRLRLDHPRPFTTLAIAAASGSGGGNGGVVLHFADGSKSRRYNLLAEDWWTMPDRRSPTAIAGLYRFYGQPGEEQIQSSDNFGFGLYETVIDLGADGLDGKTLTEIEFIKPTFSWTTGIFAVSGQSAEIQLGTHVTWPEAESAFLEIATSPDSEWNGFEDLIVMGDGTRAGVAPEGVLPRYQRSFPAELESDLLAHYTFARDGGDRLGKSDTMELSNAKPADGTLYLNGGYENDSSVNGFVAKAKINRFLYSRFTVA
jgi:hypothetical protein